ncbi:hypothetical protein F3J22_18775 [Chitinophaga sp. Cy-1792]|nr:hypothetical protein [Chitinophaga sp. Cy-1792]
MRKGERKIAYLFAGVAFVLLGLFSGFDTYRDYLVLRDGTVVKMQLADKPADCGTNKGHRQVKFSYNNEVFKKTVTAIFCKQSTVGDLVEMKYLPGSKRILFKTEQTFPTFCVDGGWIIFGLFAIASCFIGLSTPYD